MSVPGWLAYLIVFVATTLENVFPPTPSDVIVALAGFLSHHGITDPFLVFLSAWSGGMLTSAGVYFMSRRHGRQFFSGRLGRRLLPTSAVAAMEREYQRFGATGLFIARLIPGVRTFVAPFAGLVDLSPTQVLVPIALASAVWYAALTWAGAALGAEWDTIVRFIGRLNVGLAIFGVLIVVGVVVWRLAARRRNAKRELLLALHHVLMPGPAVSEPANTAALLLEIARDDETLGAVELAAIEEGLHGVAAGSSEETDASVLPLIAKSTAEVTAAIVAHYPVDQRTLAWHRLQRLLADQPSLARFRATLEAHATRVLGVGAAGE